MTDREKHIKNLSYIMDSMPDDACGEWRDSLAYAISSLKTDEAYQLMYEGGELYTKADMADMLEELNSEIRKLHVRQADQLDAGLNIGVTRCSYLIQQKIDKLRGKENEK